VPRLVRLHGSDALPAPFQRRGGDLPLSPLPAPQQIDRTVARDPEQIWHQAAMPPDVGCDILPGDSNRMHHDFLRFVAVLEHGLSDTEEPGSRQVDQLDQRLLITGDEPLAE
jgi:hypothetical protein